MKAAMMAKGSAIPAMTVKGLVIGAGKKGTVLLDITGLGSVVARPEVPFSIAIEGVPHKLVVKQITTDGVEIESPDAKETALLPSYGPIEPGVATQAGASITYVEFREATLMEALRMLADQSGNNYSASASANKTPVSAFLRHVTAESVVEEICKSHNLWFKRDEVSGITRIMSVSEFEKDLVGFREEQTEVFTLLYPNTVDVAYAIADLFGSRVELSLGNDDLQEDARDLEARFDRFNVLGRGNLTASAFQNSSTTYNGVNGATVISGQGGIGGGGGGYGEGGYGGSTSGGAYRQRLEERRRALNSNDPNGMAAERRRQQNDISDRFNDLTASQVQRLEKALESGDAAAKAEVGALRSGAPTIYVTASRRNNMVVVRTADARVLEEIRKLIQRLDVPTPLVLLEVKVITIELGDGFKSAFEYQLADGRVGGTFTSGAINPSVSYDPVTNQASGVVPLPWDGEGLRDGQLVFQYLGDSLRARIQLLESKNRINTLASPTLLTANNEVSRLFLGEERPVVRNISSQTILTDNNAATTPNTEIDFRSVGTTLLITPNINSDRTVTLRLLQENSTINRNAASIPVVTTNGGGNNGNNNGNNPTTSNVQNVPVDVVASRSVSGTFVAKDGMTVMVGGLIEDQDDDVRSQVPVLGRIPVLGMLFRRQDKNKGKREMIVLVRPHVMSTPSDGQKISEELLRDLSVEGKARLAQSGLFPAVQPVPPAATPERTAPPRALPPSSAK